MEKGGEQGLDQWSETRRAMKGRLIYHRSEPRSWVGRLLNNGDMRVKFHYVDYSLKEH